MMKKSTKSNVKDETKIATNTVSAKRGESKRKSRTTDKVTKKTDAKSKKNTSSKKSSVEKKAKTKVDVKSSTRKRDALPEKFDFDYDRPFVGDFDALVAQRTNLYAKLKRREKNGANDDETCHLRFLFNEIDEYVDFVKASRENAEDSTHKTQSGVNYQTAFVSFMNDYNARVAQSTNTTCRVVDGEFVIDGIIIDQHPLTWACVVRHEVDPLLKRHGLRFDGRTQNGYYIRLSRA